MHIYRYTDMSEMSRKMEKIFKALADRNRLRILKMLERRPLCVCEVTSVLEMAQPNASRHLGILREAGLIEDDKSGRWVNYSLSDQGDEMVSAILAYLKGWGNEDPLFKADRQKAATADRRRLCR